MGKICLSCGLAAPVIAPKPEVDMLAPTCEECPTCPNCRVPMAEKAVNAEPPVAAEDEKPASDC